ncbi:MAG TPA: UDP-3-O-(3-hydroxymyristoyl)glucosamine N-acyltransferase [Flavobacteriales bacterium]|nr:UDP-3-O-(3-hydroxymyristoyl)glucosamine N-acyltransferase [Flavobacteriales bacterium]
MKLNPALTLQEIAEIINAKYVGDPNLLVLGINEIHKVEEGDLVFVDHPKYYDKALESNATTILINKEVEVPKGKALLIAEDPFMDFNKLMEKFNPFTPAQNSVSESAEIGEGTIIQPSVFIGHNVKIGKNSIIHPNVVVYSDCTIGDDVVIHAGAVIGADAFYYQKREAGYEKLLSGGSVVIGNKVEIGASTTIDRGVSGNTVIGDGTKIDNLVQIGHDTEIGKHCLIAAQVGIAGAVVIRDNVTLWGQAGVPSDIEIGEAATVLAQSGLMTSVDGGKVYFGSPAVEQREKMKELVYLKRLPELFDKQR